MNKKIAVIPSVIIVVIIIGISQVSLDYIPEETPQVEIVEDIENMIIMPVKSARPDCGPNDECYIPSYYLAKIDETVYWKNQDSAFHSVTSGQQEIQMVCLTAGILIQMKNFLTHLLSLEFIHTTVLCIHG